MGRARRAFVGAAWALAVAGCAASDLGTPCHLLRADRTEVAPRPGHDIVQSGSGECEQFACASFAGAGALCSRPCARAGDGCEGGLVCRSAVLDAAQLGELRARTEGHDADGDGVDDFDELAAGLADSLFCGPAP